MEEQKLIYSKICEVMGGISAISKDKKNQQQGFLFRGIDDVMNTLHPLLSKAGVFIIPNVVDEVREEKHTKSGNLLYATRLTVRVRFYATDGSYVDAVVIGEAMDTADKASNKALSVAYKYACLEVFCIPTVDEAAEDPDRTTPENTYDQQQKKQPPKRQQAHKMTEAEKAAAAAALAGGASTPEEAAEIARLLEGKDENGVPVFNEDMKRVYKQMRQKLTAVQLIEKLRSELGLGPWQTVVAGAPGQKFAAEAPMGTPVQNPPAVNSQEIPDIF